MLFERGVVSVSFGWSGPDHVDFLKAAAGIQTTPTTTDGLMSGFMVGVGFLLLSDFVVRLRPVMAAGGNRGKVADDEGA